MKINKFQKVRISDIEVDLEPEDMVTIDASGLLRKSSIRGNIDGGSSTSNYILGQNIEGGYSQTILSQRINGGNA